MGDYPSTSPFQVEPDLASRLAAAKERVWFRIGVLQSTMNDRERALNAFERVLAVNPGNVRAMTQAGAVLAKKECYPQAVAYLQRAIAEDDSCGEAWAVLAHCYVMTDDLQKAYQAYQSALSHLPNPRDPNLWYGIGLLYDRYGSLDNALEAFLAVLSISPDFERADEVCFCIGIIYKEQQNFDEALKYFNKVVVAANPPPPLTRADGWYQIGHVNELKRDIPTALEMYKRALAENPKHPKTLQNFGWLEHQHNSNSTEAIRLLKRSAELDSNDGQTWYLLGRVYMALREYRQAYDAYQQAVYRDGGNATFWCSIGVLYYQMNQFRDAMDAYSRAIRLNPYVSEVWYDLGTLYEACGQNADAIDAYRRAAELAPENTQITARLGVLENSMNPSSHPQPGASQPLQSASQPMSQGQPQHVAPDMHNSSQAHMQPPLNPVLGRPIGGPVQQLSQPSTQENKLPQQQPSLEASQLHPPPHLSVQQTSMGPQHGAQNAPPFPLPSRGHMGIPSLQPPGIPSIETTQVQNGAYAQDRPNHPAPLSSIQLPAPQNPPLGDNRSSMMSHALPPPRPSQIGHAQPQSLMLAPPPVGVRQQDQMHLERSTSLPHTQLQPLSKVGAQEQQQRLQQGQIPPIEPQKHNQSSLVGPLQLTAREDQQHQRRNALEVGPMLPSQMPRQSSIPTQGPDQHQSPLQTQQQHGGTATDHMQAQPPNSLPKIQPLNPMQPISQMQQQTSEAERKSEEKPDLAAAELKTNSTPGDHPIERGPYSRPDGLRPIGYEAQERDDGSRLPALQKPESAGDGSLPSKSAGFDQDSTSRPNYSTGLSSTKPSDPVPPLRGVTEDAPAVVHVPPRSMSMREITQSEAGDHGRQTQNDNRTDIDAPDQSRLEQSRSDDNQGLDQAPPADRLPALRPLTGTTNVKGAERDPRDEHSKTLPSLATPALSLPPGNALPSISANDGEKRLSSPLLSGPPGSGTAPSLVPTASSLPPLSTRTTVTFGTENKESAGHGGSLTHGASSLTKFGKGIGRTPATPVNNSVAPSTLPSPLPTRKNAAAGGSLHSSRSPRISKPSGAPPLKSVPVAPSTSGYGGPIESVPSPSSLPVLPALSSRPSRDDGGKEQSPDDKVDRDNSLGEDGRDVHSGPKGSEKSAKDLEASGRKSDDALTNRPIFGMLRSAPAPLPTSERTQTDNDDALRSPTANSSGRAVSENVHSSKREGSAKEDSGRTAKRPRLQDVNEKDNASKPFAFGSAEKAGKAVVKETESDRTEEQNINAAATAKSDIPPFKDITTEMRGTSNSPKPDGERSHITDGGTRNGDMDMSKGQKVSAQVADIPRLSNSVPQMSSSLPISANIPLPSFRSERMNISAARAGNGGTAKSGGSEGGSSMPFLRSAPVSSMPPPLKSVAVPTGKGSKDIGEYENDGRRSQTVEDDERDTGAVKDGDPHKEEGKEHVANGGNQKNGGGATVADHEGHHRGNDLSGTEENQTKRTEVQSTAT